MKNLIKLSTLALIAASTNLYAHHPAADIVDPDVYAMIEENISDVHLAMTFEDMGGNSIDAGSAMAAQDRGTGAEMESREVMGSMADTETRGPMGSQR